MSLSKENVKNCLVRDKGFLKNLYNGDDSNALVKRRILNTADDSQLNTLIKVLYFLANGEIQMKKSHFEKLENAKKIKLIQNCVEKKSNALKLLNSSRADKLRFLLKLTSELHYLLYTLFNE